MKKERPYNAEELKKLADGRTVAQIAEKTELTYFQVYKDMRRLEIERGPKGRPVTKTNPGVEKLTKYLRDNTQEEVAEMLDVSKRTVQRWALQLAIPQRPSGMRRK